MTLVAFGINHKTAPIDIRERVAFDEKTIPYGLYALDLNLYAKELNGFWVKGGAKAEILLELF